jgi:hypothetical protein
MRRAYAIFALLALCLLAGCTVSSGVFVSMSQISTDTSLNASFVSFNGCLERRVTLEEGDVVTFRYEGGEGLCASVKQDGEQQMEIADGTVFTADADGRYAFTVEGEAKDGAFSLSWQVN